MSVEFLYSAIPDILGPQQSNRKIPPSLKTTLPFSIIATVPEPCKKAKTCVLRRVRADQESWLGQNSSAYVFPKYCACKEAGRIIPWSHSIHGIIEEVSPCDREGCKNGMNGDLRCLAFNFERYDSGHFLSDFAHNCWSSFDLSIFNVSQRMMSFLIKATNCPTECIQVLKTNDSS